MVGEKILSFIGSILLFAGVCGGIYFGWVVFNSENVTGNFFENNWQLMGTALLSFVFGGFLKMRK